MCTNIITRHQLDIVEYFNDCRVATANLIVTYILQPIRDMYEVIRYEKHAYGFTDERYLHHPFFFLCVRVSQSIQITIWFLSSYLYIYSAMQSEVESLTRMVTSFASRAGIEYTPQDIEEFKSAGNLSVLM